MPVHRYPTAGETYDALATHIVAAGRSAIAARGAFHFALAGGATPKPVYELLATAPYTSQLDWRAVHVYFGDERCVPPTHMASNYRMVHEALLAHIPIPHLQIHRMQCEHEPQTAAQYYHRILQALAPRPGQAPALDFVLLGMGADGHIASLFPGSTLLAERTQLAAATYAEGTQTWRVSVTYPVLEAAREVAILVIGTEKTRILKRAMNDDDALPVGRLARTRAIHWYLDAAAFGAQET